MRSTLKVNYTGMEAPKIVNDVDEPKLGTELKSDDG